MMKSGLISKSRVLIFSLTDEDKSVLQPCFDFDCFPSLLEPIL
jgi:hypothetical protein